MQIIYKNCLWPLAFPFGQRPKGSGGEHVSRIIAFPCGQRLLALGSSKNFVSRKFMSKKKKQTPEMLVVLLRTQIAIN